MTVIKCVSPSNISVPPTFVLAAGPIPALDDLPKDTEIGAIATSPNGWTDNELGAKWFTEIFTPFSLSQKTNSSPVLLFVDGHNSHETDEIQEIGLKMGIIIITFPSKCTHKLQPLDVTVFSPLGRKWSRHCSRCVYKNVVMDWYNMIQEYMMVRNEVFTPHLLRASFKTTGIWPFKPDIFTDEDFAPAQSFSLTTHVPKSYPHEVMTSSPVPSNFSNISDSDIDMGQSDSENNEPHPHASPAHLSQIDWDTDPDDHNFQPLSPHLSPNPMPVVLAKSHSPEDLHGQPNNHNNSPFPSLSLVHNTRSQKMNSSTPVPVSVTLNWSHIPIPLSDSKKMAEIRRLNLKTELLERENLQLRVELGASNTHCTIITRTASDCMTSLENQKRKSHQAIKTSTCFITHPALRTQWEADKQEKTCVEREKAEKEAQKATEDAKCEARIRLEIATRTFSGASLLYHPTFSFFSLALAEPLSSYKCKDDLLSLSGALGLKATKLVTVAELVANVKTQDSSRCKSGHSERSPVFWALSTRSMVAGGTYSPDRIECISI